MVALTLPCGTGLSQRVRKVAGANGSVQWCSLCLIYSACDCTGLFWVERGVQNQMHSGSRGAGICGGL